MSTSQCASSKGLEAWEDVAQWLGMEGGLPDKGGALAWG